jgi:hypothetical protein
MADVHIWDGEFSRTSWDKTTHETLYLALCGASVHGNELAFPIDRSIEPTCMGCILMKFQQMAEEQDG